MPAPTPALPARDERVLSVAELNRLARGVLESNIPLLWVAGEISNLTYAASGHVYFSLKDEGAQVRCTMWRNRAQSLPFRLANGMNVEARALVTLYEARGDYQLNVDALRQAGIGALYEAFARLRQRLEAEGLFIPARKRPLPRYPRRVGIVTSLQAAALRDVLAAFERRTPSLPLVIYPAPVQGEGAAAQLAAALRSAAARQECDVLILCRGGGSIEDLWAFNEEVLARAIAACAIPVVCGVGHETDTTIADFVADQRAATPTAAAELVTAGYVDAAQHLARLAPLLQRALWRRLENLQQRVDIAARSLVHPGERLARMRLATDHCGARLAAAVRGTMETAYHAIGRHGLRLRGARPQFGTAQQSLQHLARRLAGALQHGQEQRQARLEALHSHLVHLDPRQVLARGYSIVRDASGTIVRSSGQLAAGCEVDMQFAAGKARATVTRTD
jgi:exodeoxyribonuclease VII large subunit